MRVDHLAESRSWCCHFSRSSAIEEWMYAMIPCAWVWTCELFYYLSTTLLLNWSDGSSCVGVSINRGGYQLPPKKNTKESSVWGCSWFLGTPTCVKLLCFTILIDMVCFAHSWCSGILSQPDFCSRAYGPSCSTRSKPLMTSLWKLPNRPMVCVAMVWELLWNNLTWFWYWLVCCWKFFSNQPSGYILRDDQLLIGLPLKLTFENKFGMYCHWMHVHVHVSVVMVAGNLGQQQSNRQACAHWCQRWLGFRKEGH